jgi:hypothetical protein
MAWFDPATSYASGGLDRETGQNYPAALYQRLMDSLSWLAGSNGIPILRNNAPTTPVANTLYKDNQVSGWVKFNGTGTPAITDDVNVASITDNGVGDYTFNFATNLASANYAVVASSDGGRVVRNSTQAVGSSRLQWTEAGAAGAAYDPTAACVVWIGE